MSPGSIGADLRGWLEAAILSTGAALPSASASERTSRTEAMAESTTTVAKTPTTSSTAAKSLPIGRPAEDNFKRSLVTVRRITDMRTLKVGYRLIEIDGWKVVTKKGERFAKGQYVLFFEPDSFVPATSSLGNLFAEVGTEITLGNEAGYRVGSSVWTDEDGHEIISQGHVLHLDHSGDLYKKVLGMHWNHLLERKNEEFASVMRHIDFSDDLGVKKWEGPGDLDTVETNTVEEPAKNPEDVKTTVEENTPEEPANIGKGALEKSATNNLISDIPTSNPDAPSFIMKTSMQRVQNCPNLFTKPKYKRFVYQESLKMDGASMTIYFIKNDSAMFDTLPKLPAPTDANSRTYLKYAVHPNGRLGVCSRNKDLMPHLPPSTTSSSHKHYWDAAIAANLHKILPQLNETIAIQAELVGQTIQENPYNYPKTPNGPTHELFIFTILDFQPTRGPANTSPTATMTPKRRNPRSVETFATSHGLPHVPVLGYHKIPDVARAHEDLMARAELEKGEGLVYKCCSDGRWFKVLSERWIVEKGDEKLVRAAQAKKMAEGKGKGEGKGEVVLAGETKAAVERQEARCAGGYFQMSKEEARQVMAVFRDLEEWMKRDDGLRLWMEEWKRGYPRGLEEDLDFTEGRKYIERVESGGSGMGRDGGAGGQMKGGSGTVGGSAFNGVTAKDNGQTNGISGIVNGAAVTGIGAQQGAQINGINTTAGGSAFNSANGNNGNRVNVNRVNVSVNGVNINGVNVNGVNVNGVKVNGNGGNVNGNGVNGQQNGHRNDQGNESTSGFSVAQSVVNWLGL